ADAAPYQVGSLKREELIASNSMVLHELYFANLGGNGRLDGSAASLLTAEYGSIDTWEHDFRRQRCRWAAAPDGSSSPTTGRPVRFITGGHGTTPIRSRAASLRRCSIFTSTPTTWTSAQRRKRTSRRSSRTCHGMK